jgi:hypothetical protein
MDLMKSIVFMYGHTHKLAGGSAKQTTLVSAWSYSGASLPVMSPVTALVRFLTMQGADVRGSSGWSDCIAQHLQVACCHRTVQQKIHTEGQRIYSALGIFLVSIHH